MNLLLVALAAASSANPARISVASRGDRRGIAEAAGGLYVTLVMVAWLSGPINDLIGISGSSSAIAAGIALLTIGARDALVSPPSLEGCSSPVPSAIFPLFFPTMFTPAIALVAVAGGAERGVAPAAAMMFVGIGASVCVAIGLKYDFAEQRPHLIRAIAAFVGVGAVAVGALIATHGVMSI